MAKIQGPKHTPKPTSAAAAAAPNKSAAAAAVKAPKAGTTFPRSAWQDGQKLGVALEKAKAQTAGHPRLKPPNPTPHESSQPSSAHDDAPRGGAVARARP